jgi:hypothetical protein
VASFRRHIVQRLGQQEALRRINEVADALMRCLAEKFPDIEAGTAVVVFDPMARKSLERSVAIVDGMPTKN